MANVAVHKVEPPTGKPVPLFLELEKRFEEVRRRAFELFERRGCEIGHALEDWLKAERDLLGWPAAEFLEADSKYELAITLPGYGPKDVEVTATPSEIIVHAKTEPQAKTEGAKCVWSEFGPNDLYRRFQLPESIDVENTKATLEKGMLHITAVKLPPAQAKTIQIRAA